MVKNRWSYISTAPVCLHGLDGNNFRYGNEDSINVVNTIGNAGLCSEMLLYLVYMLRIWQGGIYKKTNTFCLQCGEKVTIKISNNIQNGLIILCLTMRFIHSASSDYISRLRLTYGGIIGSVKWGIIYSYYL